VPQSRYRHRTLLENSQNDRSLKKGIETRGAFIIFSKGRDPSVSKFVYHKTLLGNLPPRQLSIGLRQPNQT
jgi:hypothetical protein